MFHFAGQVALGWLLVMGVAAGAGCSDGMSRDELVGQWDVVELYGKSVAEQLEGEFGPGTWREAEVGVHSF